MGRPRLRTAKVQVTAAKAKAGRKPRLAKKAIRQLRLSGKIPEAMMMQCGPLTRQHATWTGTEMWQSKNWHKSVEPSIKTRATLTTIPGAPTEFRTPNNGSIQYDRH